MYLSAGGVCEFDLEGLPVWVQVGEQDRFEMHPQVGHVRPNLAVAQSECQNVNKWAIVKWKKLKLWYESMKNK